ncbi:hypothetical protein WK68_14720 [Burkholderia ubonensis]|nr:hypothetical protein WK68_14720 [Burkholderia ubonensis]
MMQSHEGKMQGVKSMIRLLGVMLLLSIGIHDAVAHGAVGVPIARQYQCRLEGGYDWPPDGANIPHPDCRMAYQSGGNSPFAFQQWNEINANPQGWGDNQQELEKAVPDGLICAAGDQRKAGLDLAPASIWRKTQVVPTDGEIEIRWDNTQAHNPAWMRVYLSKTSYNPSRPLRWSDLDKIYDASAPNPNPANGGGRLSNVSTFYRLNVPIPSGRTGDAVLVSYWQRQDSGNEGFINCSDISIGTGTVDPGFPWLDSAPYLESGFAPKVGDTVRFRVMGGSARGAELVDVHHSITESNHPPTVWAKELADILNRRYNSYVQIGVRSGSAIQYNETDLAANRVWLKSGYSSAMGLVSGPEPTPPITGTLTVLSPVKGGDRVPVNVDAQSATGRPLKYTWSRTSELFDGAIGNSPSGYYTARVVVQQTSGTIGVTVEDDQNHSLKIPGRTVTVEPAGGGEPLLPTVSLATPQVSGYAPASVNLSATATVNGATISKVEFFNGTTKVGEKNSAPYTVTWANVAAGKYSVTAKATTSQNASATSAPAPFAVAEAPSDGACNYRDPAAPGVPAWQSKTYNAGERVSYLNVIWQASYSTGTAAPDRNDAWVLVSVVPVPYNAARAYEGGTQVIYQGFIYRAGWWIKGTAPPASPWTETGRCR